MITKFFKPFLDPRHGQLVISAILGLITFLGFTIYQVINTRNIEINQAHHTSMNFSQLISEQISGTFEKVDLGLKNINLIVREKGPNYHWDKKKFEEILTNELSYVPEVKSYRVVDEFGDSLGITLEQTNIAKHNKNIADRKYFQALKTNPKDELVISEPLLSKTLGVWVVVLTRRLYSFDGTFKGAIITNLELANFENIFKKLNIGKNGHVILMDYKNRYLWARHPTSAKHIGKVLPLHPNFEELLAEDHDAGAIRTHAVINPVPTMNGYKVNRAYNFMVVAALAESDYLGIWKTQCEFISVGIIFMLVVFIFIFHSYLLSLDQLEVQRINLIESSKMSTLGEMAAGIAHEINNPLAIILGLGKQLKTNLMAEPIDKEALIKSIDKVIRTTDRIAGIVKGLRYFSRDGSKDPFEEVNVAQLVGDTVEFTKDKLQSCGVTLRISNFDQQLTIEARAVEISQVLFNLINNAVDAVENLPDKWVEITLQVQPDYINLRVTDSGSGLPQELHNKIFEPFFTTKEVGKGTGLGLSISIGIIRSHGGVLKIDHTSQNTCFLLTLPIRQF
jgi:signal transduction histidine kinase